MARKAFEWAALRLPVGILGIAVAMSTIGCGGPDQSTGSTIEPDPGAAKRQDDMTKFYAKNPLPKPKR
jgi:hypothetical protein